MAQLAEVAFWAALAVLAYSFVGYPCAVALLARGRPRPVAAGDLHPSVTVIIPAYHEGAVIGAKIENGLELDYPRERLEILGASDGSPDETEAVAARDAARGGGVGAPPRHPGGAPGS